MIKAATGTFQPRKVAICANSTTTAAPSAPNQAIPTSARLLARLPCCGSATEIAVKIRLPISASSGPTNRPVHLSA